MASAASRRSRARPVPSGTAASAAGALLAAALLLGLPAEAAGQVVQGRVVEEGSGSPASGALLALVDTAGREVAEALADGEGRYRLAAPRPGRYRVRVERIGFETWTSAPLDLGPGETRSRRLRLPVEPVQLSAVGASVERRCRGDPGEGEATARLWSEARKALEATSRTEEQGLLKFEVDRWRRELTPDLDVRSESGRTETGRGLRPFVSAPVSWLSDEGWVQKTGGFREYYGPDAGALLSSAFQRTHCFGVREDGPEPGWVGLDFKPSPGREVADIAGVMWLDAESAELQRVEFHYVQADLPPGARHAGGRVDFERLPNGAWIVEDWRIRMPISGRERIQIPSAVSGGTRESHAREVVASYQEEAGEVAKVWDRDGDRLPLGPKARVAKADAAGAGDGDAAPETAGRDTAGAGPGRAPSADAERPGGADAAAAGPERPEPPEEEVDRSGDGIRETLDRLGLDEVDDERILTDTAQARAGQRETPGADGGRPATIAGRVRDSETGEPVPAARVRVGDRTAVTDSTGRFRIEGVPAGRVGVEVEFMGFQARRSEMVVPGGETVHPTLHVRSRPADVSDLSVTVEGTRMTGKMAGFWEREQTGMGRYVTREEIEKAAGGLENVFRKLSGVKVVRCPGQYPPPDCHRIAANRRQPSLGSQGGACEVDYWIDGSPVTIAGQRGITDLVSGREVEAIEVYSGPAQLPPQFGGAQGSCGAVVIWTRSGGS